MGEDAFSTPVHEIVVHAVERLFDAVVDIFSGRVGAGGGGFGPGVVVVDEIFGGLEEVGEGADDGVTEVIYEEHTGVVAVVAVEDGEDGPDAVGVMIVG